MGGRRRRRRIEPNENWEQLALLCRWPEQLAYEEIRPLTLFGSPVVERARSGYPNGELALGVRGAERPERIRRLVELRRHPPPCMPMRRSRLMGGWDRGVIPGSAP